MNTRPVVLVFGGTDPTGGAGLPADIQTLTRLGCHPAPIVTAITIQDSHRVHGYEAIDASRVGMQAGVILKDFECSVIKTGMLATAATVQQVAERAQRYRLPVVVDPVLASGAGDALADDDLLAALRQLLLPHTLLATPNTHEARALAGGETDPDAQARLIADFGCRWLLITGTHDEADDKEITHRLYHQGEPVRTFTQPRLPGEFHGSGCTLASACAAFIAGGVEMESVIEQALVYTHRSLTRAIAPGKGQLIPGRFATE